jgi:hypothetical protein
MNVSGAAQLMGLPALMAAVALAVGGCGDRQATPSRSSAWPQSR